MLQKVIAIGCVLCSVAIARHHHDVNQDSYRATLASLDAIGKTEMLMRDLDQSQINLGRRELRKVFLSAKKNKAARSAMMDKLNQAKKYTPTQELLYDLIGELEPNSADRHVFLKKVMWDKTRELGLRKRAMGVLFADNEYVDSDAIYTMLRRKGLTREEKNVICSKWLLFINKQNSPEDAVNADWLENEIRKTWNREGFPQDMLKLFRGCNRHRSLRYLQSFLKQDTESVPGLRRNIVHTIMYVAGSSENLLMGQPELTKVLIEDYYHDHCLSSPFGILHRDLSACIDANWEDMLVIYGKKDLLRLALMSSPVIRKHSEVTDDMAELALSGMKSQDAQLRLLSYRWITVQPGSHVDKYEMIKNFFRHETDPKCIEFLETNYTTALIEKRPCPFEPKR